MNTAWNIAIVGAGPVGLALALQCAKALPQASIHLFDTRALDADLGADPRTLALSLGSVQALQRLAAWPAEAAAPILQVHISQQQPALGLLPTPWGPAQEPGLLLHHDALGVPQLGAVLGYGALLAALQQAWLQAAAAEPERLHTRFGTAVQGIARLPLGAQLSSRALAADSPLQAQGFDLAVLAEGGLFGEQAARPLRRDYAQTAWIGEGLLAGAVPGRAVERFTRGGPVALLPLPPRATDPAGLQRAALVWCVASAGDEIGTLSDTQRIAVLNSLLPPEAGRVQAVSPLKGLPLGLNAERTLVQGRVVRIGNAAQTLHPVAGQGLNLGLRDAQVLLAALREGRELDAALRRAAWQRAPDRWATIATTDFLARSFTWQFPGAAAARGLGLAAMQAVPPLQRLLARQMMFGWR